ncbi:MULTISPECIES: anhydro-N-acetylmuramic acid kinase [unclassified Sphingomonas]|uniref:anhydro-N-acetylmuramic acid kinase n=1 Tax=unclassified Sphingomonas TaxID=196159 RepID=UPI0009E97DB6|nr:MULTISPECIES: anhydro-N-acetylmuramic acid kinase [unclassified Sphingomonas]
MLAIGLMSGTSLDGIDAALIETDGKGEVRPIAFVGTPYSDDDRATLASATELALLFDDPGEHPLIERAEELLTRTHAAAVAALLEQAGVEARAVDVIGYHGQTVAHRPDKGWTWQLGDGAALAAATGIDVVAGLRVADVQAGGQGAPLLPVYHAALVEGMDKPVAVLNLGGVGNITYVGEDGALIAFDTGPANGLVDSWVEAESGARYDEGGALAASGRVDAAVLTAMLDHPFFELPHPKSLDRHDFTIQPARGLSAADGAATLTAFTAACVAEAIDRLPARPKRLFVGGGGRRNPEMLRMIGERCGLTAEPSDAIGWDGDALEAEGFAYLAVRSLKGLPITFPGTTGVAQPLTGGVLYPAPRSGLALRLVSA